MYQEHRQGYKKYLLGYDICLYSTYFVNNYKFVTKNSGYEFSIFPKL